MSRAAALLVAVAVAGCALGPNYRRPSTPMTSAYRGQTVAEATSFADLPWWDVYHDPDLNALIVEALEHSYDLQDAVARVEQARQNANISTDQLLPSLGITGGPSYQQVFVPPIAPGAPPNIRFAAYGFVGGVTSWEVDLWGKLRRLRQSAFAQFFASEDNRRGVIVSLIASIAQSYFSLLVLDLQVEITQRTEASREETLKLFHAREAGGVGDGLDTTAEEALVADARANLFSLRRQIVETENRIALLVGRVPGPVRRPAGLLTRPVPDERPIGMPASLLERRPDIRQAEGQLVSANAQVGAAFASLFPTINLTGLVGLASPSLDSLFTSNGFTFLISMAASWLAPILNGAQTAHRWRAQQAAYRQALADYRRTVLNALVEVSNALTAIENDRGQCAQLELEVAAQRKRVELARARFTNGVANYLDVVNAEQNLYAAELSLASAVGAQFSAAADLYRALGGGWKVPPPPPPAAPPSRASAAAR